MSQSPSKTPLLDKVNTPVDLRKLDPSDLRQFADELRQEMIDAVAVTGGHLGAGLGVVELTVALHYVFNTPFDRLIWSRSGRLRRVNFSAFFPCRACVRLTHAP